MLWNIYEWLLSCASPCGFHVLPSWKALVLLAFSMVVVMLIGHWTRKILCSRFNDTDVKPFIDLIHHAEISFIIQAQILFFMLSTNSIAWKLFLMIAFIYYQIESPCFPAEANPIYGIVKTGIRHFKFNCQDDSTPEERNQHNVVTQRLISWTIFFFVLSYFYAKLYHIFFLQLLHGIVDSDNLEMRFCCVMDSGFYWLIPFLEMLGVYLFIRLTASACYGSSFVGESFVRVIFMIMCSVFGMAVYPFLNPLTTLLTFAVCDYHVFNLARFAALIIATFVSVKMIERAKKWKKNKGSTERFDRAEEMGENNSAQNNSAQNNEPRRLLDVIISSILDEFPDEPLDKTCESCMENYSFAISIWLQRWLAEKFEKFKAKLYEVVKRRIRNPSTETMDPQTDYPHPDTNDEREYFEEVNVSYRSDSFSSCDETISDFDGDIRAEASTYRRSSKDDYVNKTKTEHSLYSRSSRNDFKFDDNAEPFSRSIPSTSYDNSEVRKSHKSFKHYRYKRTFRNRSKLMTGKEFPNVKSKNKSSKLRENKFK